MTPLEIFRVKFIRRPKLFEIIRKIYRKQKVKKIKREENTLMSEYSLVRLYNIIIIVFRLKG